MPVFREGFRPSKHVVVDHLVWMGREVKGEHGSSNPFTINGGVQQGCALRPCLSPVAPAAKKIVLEFAIGIMTVQATNLWQRYFNHFFILIFR